MQKSKRIELILVIVLMLGGIVGCGANPGVSGSSTPTATDTPTLVPTDTSTLVPTDTSTLVPTDTSTLVPTDTLVPTNTPAPGTQIHADAGNLGMFTLTLASDDSAIIKVSLMVNDLQCGSTHVSQTSVDVSNVWPITQQAFHIDAANNSLLDVVIAGRVDTDFHHASGTWTGNAFGSTCSGSWLG